MLFKSYRWESLPIIILKPFLIVLITLYTYIYILLGEYFLTIKILI